MASRDAEELEKEFLKLKEEKKKSIKKIKSINKKQLTLLEQYSLFKTLLKKEGKLRKKIKIKRRKHSSSSFIHWLFNNNEL